MKEILDKLDNITNLNEHYLVKAKTSGHSYFTEFLEAADIIRPLLTPKEFEYWCLEKMLLKQQPFAEKTFIQYAVETKGLTVMCNANFAAFK